MSGPPQTKRRPRGILRRIIDASWDRVIDTLTREYNRSREPGHFRWNHGHVVLTLADGRTYEGRAVEPRPNEFLVGTLSGVGDDTLNADGSRPVYWPDNLDLWPMQIKVFRPGKDGLRRGVVWLPHARGRLRGELYRVTAVSRQSGLHGVVIEMMAYRHVGADELDGLLRAPRR